MTSTELIAEIARKTRLSRATVSRVLYALPHTVVEELQHGGQVKIKGFGAFLTKAPRSVLFGREVKPRIIIRFKESRRLREQLSQQKEQGHGKTECGSG